MKAINLTPAEKTKLQNEKQLYVLLRLIHLVEQYHNYDKISDNDYREEMAKLTEKYQRFTQIIPNFTLVNFLREHEINEDQVAWAKLALQKGVGKGGAKDNKIKTFLYMQATAKFIQVNDTLATYAQQPIIGQIKTPIEQLLLILKSIHSQIGPEFTQKYKNLERMQTIPRCRNNQYLSDKGISEILASNEFNELKQAIESTYRILEFSMKS